RASTPKRNPRRCKGSHGAEIERTREYRQLRGRFYNSRWKSNVARARLDHQRQNQRKRQGVIIGTQRGCKPSTDYARNIGSAILSRASSLEDAALLPIKLFCLFLKQRGSD